MERKIKRLFTSEHVSPGHPDKVCDQISDAVLDAHYSESPSTSTRVAVETLVKGGKVVLAGEITSKANIEYQKLVRSALEDIGYIPEVSPVFNTKDFDLETLFTGQSPDIDACVSKKEIGAGDQGIMFGYAVNEAPDLTGWAHFIARNLVSELWKMKLANDSTGMHSICPDYKVQVTIDYSEKNPKVDTVLVSVSHTRETDLGELKNSVERLVRNTISAIATVSHVSHDLTGNELELLNDSDYKVLVNPYGPFTVFGPFADSGLTGRKIVCDQYGGYAPVGGGAFSGKDLTKVDRTAAYMARFVAKNIMNKLVHGYLDSPLDNPYDCSVEVAYIIGQAEPVSVNVTVKDKSGDTWLVPEETLEKVFDRPIYKLFKPVESIRYLHLEQVRYEDVAAFGHIGVDTQHIRKPWEQLI